MKMHPIHRARTAPPRAAPHGRTKNHPPRSPVRRTRFAVSRTRWCRTKIDPHRGRPVASSRAFAGSRCRDTTARARGIRRGNFSSSPRARARAFAPRARAGTFDCVATSREGGRVERRLVTSRVTVHRFIHSTFRSFSTCRMSYVGIYIPDTATVDVARVRRARRARALVRVDRARTRRRAFSATARVAVTPRRGVARRRGVGDDARAPRFLF